MCDDVVISQEEKVQKKEEPEPLIDTKKYMLFILLLFILNIYQYIKQLME